ncbi:hypothetical protein GQR58_017052 [Nymphon striatum]|nr:hypothetical protein GQR58_017052 [Nymphon striatum]
MTVCCFKTAMYFFIFYFAWFNNPPTPIRLIRSRSCVCYFPLEYHGVYMSQTMTSGISKSFNKLEPIQYQAIKIEVDQISPWGRCHEMFGNNVILWDSFRGSQCMRCFHISRKSPNVIQLYTENLAKCYTNLAAARARCPGEDRLIDLKKAEEITVYRTRDPSGRDIEPVYCAINGKFKFTYTGNDELSNCPQGMGINMNFTECSFGEISLNFKCLGDWSGINGKRYLALLDTRDREPPRAKYRCAIYEKDELTGEVKLSLSVDSTCTNDLISATEGYELLSLKPVPPMSWPTRVQASNCFFPRWAQGEWENMNVESNEITFEDHALFQTSRMRCISDQSNSTHGVFHVYSITHCGEESEVCLLMKKRSPNVVEVMFEMLQHSVHNSQGRCWGQFDRGTWITQGKKRNMLASSCPIEGDYYGEVPGAGGLCAKVSSDCNNPEIMFYTVSNCKNRTHLYEEREYQCLGQWEENGVLFTYTQRRDLPGYFCFTGMIKSGTEAFIKEAGTNCERGEDPELYGMRLNRQAVCNQLTPTTLPPRRRPNWTPKPNQHRPWNPYTEQTRAPGAWLPTHGNNKHRPKAPDFRVTRLPTTRSWYPITAYRRVKGGTIEGRGIKLGLATNFHLSKKQNKKLLSG